VTHIFHQKTFYHVLLARVKQKGVFRILDYEVHGDLRFYILRDIINKDEIFLRIFKKNIKFEKNDILDAQIVPCGGIWMLISGIMITPSWNKGFRKIMKDFNSF
jgi:hypothetical protein